MEGVDARQIEALKTERLVSCDGRDHHPAEHLGHSRVGRIEGHLNSLARDQNNALKSNQATWRRIQELKARAMEMNLKKHDVGASMEQKLREVQGLPYHGLHNELNKEVYETLAEYTSTLVAKAIFDKSEPSHSRHDFLNLDLKLLLVFRESSGHLPAETSES